MSIKRGCLKPTLFGCLGLLVFGFLFMGISAFLAWRGLDRQRVEDHEMTPVISGTSRGREAIAGRVILDLGQGEFQIKPARAGEGVRVEARYDQAVYELVENFEVLPDSSWVYGVRFRRTMPALQALFRALMGGDTDSYVHVYLPPDIEIALEVLVQQGGFEAELGGLWISEADVGFKMGGFSLSVGEPLRKPMERMSIKGRMGGFEAERLGNASPRSLSIDCKMGGADVDLRGAWLQDCDIQLTVRMGGMSVMVPDEVDVVGIPTLGSGLLRKDPEIPQTVLRFSVSESMGEIEVIPR